MSRSPSPPWKWIRDYGIPAAAFLATASATLYRFETCLQQHEQELARLREEISHSHDVGPTGILDPIAHGTFDSAIRHWHEEYFGAKGWRELSRTYQNGGETSEWRP